MRKFGTKHNMAAFAVLKLFAGISALVIGFFALLAVLWLFGFRDPTSARTECAFGSVTKSKYRQLLERAKGQDWSVWPGLSNGIFWPSDRGLNVPTTSFKKSANEKILSAINKLTVNSHSADMQLAAAHAVMSSIHAEYVNVFNIPDLRQNGELVSSKIYFEYLMPQNRYAPLCLFCLVFWNSNISIVFDHNIASGSYRLDQINIFHSNPKFVPKFDHYASGMCPSFPEDHASRKGG